MATTDNSEFIVYEDDACLGKECPDLTSLQFFNGDSLPDSKEKALIITFFSKLNKSDFPTLTVLNSLQEKDEFKGKIVLLGISRDGAPSDVEKFPGKYKNKFMAELKGPNNEAGYDVKFDYPLGYDESHKVNGAFKTLAQKAVVGVGMTFIVKDGKIKWFEYFIRGNNPMKQFETQLTSILEGKELLSNGKTPEVEDEVIEDDAGVVPTNADPFGDLGAY